MRQSILLLTSAQDRSSPAHHVQTISRVPAYLNLHFLFGNPHVRQGKRLQAERERAGNGCVRRGRIRPPPRAPQRLQPGCSAPSRLPSPAPGRCHSGHVGSCPTCWKHRLCAVRAARLLRAPARCQCCRAVGSPGPARPGPGSRGRQERRHHTQTWKILRSLVSDAKAFSWCPATFSIAVAERLGEKKKMGFVCFL